MLSNGNSHEKTFRRISNSYFESYFSLNFVEIFMFFKANLKVMCKYSMPVQTKPMKIIGFFNEIQQKIWFKIGVGNLTKIFFLRIAIWQLSWPLRVSAVTSETLFPRKTMKFSCFSMFVGTVGIPIVNGCTTVSRYRTAHFCEGEEPEANCSNFMNS